MKWSVYDLNWGRPLKSIVAIFNNRVVNFDFFHLQSSNLISIDETNENKSKKINSFNDYLKALNFMEKRVDKINPKTFIGKGSIIELEEISKSNDIDVVIF